MEKDLTVFKHYLKYVVFSYSNAFQYEKYISKTKFASLAFKLHFLVTNGLFDVEFRYNKYDKFNPIISKTLHQEFFCDLGGEFGFIDLNKHKELTDDEKEIIVNNIIVPIYDNVINITDKVDGENKVEKGDLLFRRFIVTLGVSTESAILQYDRESIFRDDILQYIEENGGVDYIFSQEIYDRFLIAYEDYYANQLNKEHEANPK